MDYIFTLTASETQIIMKGLGKLLLEDAAGTFAKICMQKEAQDKTSNIVSTKQPNGENSQSLRDVGST